MTRRFNTEENLKTRHFIEMDQIHAEQKIAELKNKKFLLAVWEKLKTRRTTTRPQFINLLKK